MSINTDMKSYLLQKNEPIRTESGANRDHWVAVERIDVAVYKKNDLRTTTSIAYTDSTNTGLTWYKGFVKAVKYRLVLGKDIFDIMDSNADSRLTNLLLKAVY